MWSLDEIAVGVIKAVNTNEFNEMRYGWRFNNLPRKSSFLSAAAGFAGLWAAIVQIVGGARDRPRKPPKKIPGLRTTHPFLPVLPLSHFSFSASYTVQHKRCWSVQHNDLESSSTVICCLYLKTGFGWSGGCFFSFHLFSQTRRVIQIVVRRSTAESWLHNSLVVFCTKLLPNGKETAWFISSDWWEMSSFKESRPMDLITWLGTLRCQPSHGNSNNPSC